MLYSYRCPTCSQKLEAFRKVDDRHDSPLHCGIKSVLEITGCHHVAPMFEAYRAVGIPGRPWIRTKQEHRDTLRRHNKIEVGDDASMAAPKISDAEFEHNKQQQLKEIRESYAETAKLGRDLAQFVD